MVPPTLTNPPVVAYDRPVNARSRIGAGPNRARRLPDAVDSAAMHSARRQVADRWGDLKAPQEVAGASSGYARTCRLNASSDVQVQVTSDVQAQGCFGRAAQVPVTWRETEIAPDAPIDSIDVDDEYPILPEVTWKETEVSPDVPIDSIDVDDDSPILPEVTWRETEVAPDAPVDSIDVDDDYPILQEVTWRETEVAPDAPIDSTDVDDDYPILQEVTWRETEVAPDAPIDSTDVDDDGPILPEVTWRETEVAPDAPIDSIDVDDDYPILQEVTWRETEAAPDAPIDSIDADDDYPILQEVTWRETEVAPDAPIDSTDVNDDYPILPEVPEVRSFELDPEDDAVPAPTTSHVEKAAPLHVEASGPTVADVEASVPTLAEQLAYDTVAVLEDAIQSLKRQASADAMAEVPGLEEAIQSLKRQASADAMAEVPVLEEAIQSLKRQASADAMAEALEPWHDLVTGDTEPECDDQAAWLCMSVRELVRGDSEPVSECEYVLEKTTAAALAEAPHSARSVRSCLSVQSARSVQRQRTVHFDDAATSYVEAPPLCKQLTDNATRHRRALLLMSPPQITNQVFLCLDLCSAAALAAVGKSAVQTVPIRLHVLRAALQKMKDGHRLVRVAIEAAINAEAAMNADSNRRHASLLVTKTASAKQQKRRTIMEIFGKMLVARSAFSTVFSKKRKCDTIMESFMRKTSPAICA